MNRLYYLPVGIALAVVAADQATKRMAHALFADGDVSVIGDFFGFTFVENPGAAFSLFGNAGPLFGVAAILVTVGVLWVLRHPRPTLERVGLGLVLGGALGNLIDRIVRGDGFLDGKVIDWVNLWWIPTFNLADATLTAAVVLLVIETWLNRETS